MRRTATYLLATLGIALTLILTGCKSTTKKETSWDSKLDLTESYADASEQASYDEPDRYPVYGVATPSQGLPTPSQGAAFPVETTYEPALTAPAPVLSGSRYHTVVKHDTLYGLARTYYGDHRRWKDIYEANRSIIGNPNRILVGQRLVIP